MRSLRLFGLLASFTVEVASAEPFLTRDQNALLGGLAFPLPVRADLPSARTTHVDLVTNWSSTTSSGLDSDEALLVDLESRELRLLVEHSLSARFSFRVQIPYRHLSPGVLDGFIDGWHELLGLPQGPRKFLERNQFQIGYIRGTETVLNLRRPLQGLGDVTVEGGYQWWRSAKSAAALWLSIEAPTGSNNNLLGNGAWDAGISLAGLNRLGARNTVYWQVGTTYQGKGGPLARWQKDWSVSASGTYEYAVSPTLQVKAQVDAHSASYQSGVDFLGRALILTVGGSHHFPSGLILNLGLGEDLDVGASPDVNFCFSLSRLF